MESKIHHFRDISIVDGDIKININMNRFGEQFNRAQFWLDSQVMTDMVPLMPHVTGTFINQTRQRSAAMAGTGRVCAAAPPHGRYLYMGKVMVDRKTGKGPRNIPGIGPRFMKGAILKATDRNLTYSNPRTVPKWFDEAKRIHGQQWVKGVKDIAGGK